MSIFFFRFDGSRRGIPPSRTRTRDLVSLSALPPRPRPGRARSCVSTKGGAARCGLALALRCLRTCSDSNALPPFIFALYLSLRDGPGMFSSCPRIGATRCSNLKHRLENYVFIWSTYDGAQICNATTPLKFTQPLYAVKLGNYF